MAATLPVRFDNPPMPQPATENMFMDAGKTWAPGVGKTSPELVTAVSDIELYAVDLLGF